MLFMWFHLVAVTAWIGGMLFYSLVLRPAVGQALSTPEGLEIRHRIQTRFRAVRWLSLLVLIITGLWNLLHEGASARLDSTWGGILLVKLLLVAIAVGLTAVQDFILSPNIRPAPQESPSRMTDWVSNGILLLGLSIVLISVYMTGF